MMTNFKEKIMKKHPLYKNHEDVFKSRQPVLYYLTKVHDDEGLYLLLSIISTICIVSFTALSMIVFFNKGSWSALFWGISLFTVVSILLKKVSKQYVDFSKGLSLEKRKKIAKDVLITTDEMIKNSGINVDQVSKKCIDEFRKKVNKNLTNLLSDDDVMIYKGACYFFNDSEVGSFIGDFGHLKQDIFLANIEFKNQLSKQKSVSVAEKRVEKIASSI